MERDFGRPVPEALLENLPDKARNLTAAGFEQGRHAAQRLRFRSVPPVFLAIALEDVPGQGLGEICNQVERQHGLCIVDDRLGSLCGALSWHGLHDILPKEFGSAPPGFTARWPAASSPRHRCMPAGPHVLCDGCSRTAGVPWSEASIDKN